jgi:transposase-like protein
VVLCVRWYLSFKLSYRDLVSMMNERGISLAHTTILRWVQHYTPEFVKRWQCHARAIGGSWRMDETYGALSSARFRRVQVPPVLE